MIGGRSKLLIDWRAYWPTPCRSNTVSVRIAPPPSTAAKSRPKSVTIGISDVRSTCFTEDPARREALRLGGAHVVLVDRVEDVPAQHAAVEADEEHGQDEPRQDQVA